jgi:hypothetical protein
MFGGIWTSSGTNLVSSLMTREEAPIYLLAKRYADSLKATTLLARPNWNLRTSNCVLIPVGSFEIFTSVDFFDMLDEGII